MLKVKLRLNDDEITCEDFDVLFKQGGHFVDEPETSANPDSALEQRKFFEVLERCMQGLQKNTERVFMMREVMGHDTDEICAELSITANNCWVLLYRARMSLRACLQEQWFVGTARA